MTGTSTRSSDDGFAPGIKTGPSRRPVDGRSTPTRASPNCQNVALRRCPLRGPAAPRPTTPGPRSAGLTGPPPSGSVDVCGAVAPGQAAQSPATRRQRGLCYLSKRGRPYCARPRPRPWPGGSSCTSSNFFARECPGGEEEAGVLPTTCSDDPGGFCSRMQSGKAVS